MRAIAFAVFLALGSLQAATNIYSRIADMRSAGARPDAGGIVLDEASSLVAWLACMVVIWALVARLRPPRFGWPATIGLHALATVPVSLLHVGLMVALRELGHWFAGGDYHFTDDLGASLLYEYRKDALTYVLLAAFAAAVQWIARGAERRPAPEGRAILEVPDGSVTHRVPLAEIDRAEASGNYVTIHWGARELLHRITLAALADQLGADFARIHRSRVVRRAAVRSVATERSGDFAVTLEDGTILRGSRRYRENLR